MSRLIDADKLDAKLSEEAAVNHSIGLYDVCSGLIMAKQILKDSPTVKVENDCSGCAWESQDMVDTP